MLTAIPMRTIIVVVTILLTAPVAFGQIEATTKDGKKIILNENGTWKYSDEPSAEKKLPANPADCTSWIETHEDKVTGTKTTGAKENLVISDDGGKTGLGIYWMSSGKNPILNIKAVGAGNCINDDSKINVLFKDGTRTELVTNNKFNCDGDATLYFLGVFGKKQQLELLTTKKIETMRVWTSKSFVEKNFDDVQAETFMRTGKCLWDSVK